MKHATIPEAVAEKATAVRTTVARNLSAELRAQRWSQRAAATALGLTPRYVNSRAHGDVDMSASDLALFAEFLNIPIARFFDEHHDSDGNVTSINAKKGTKPGSLVPKVGASPAVAQITEHPASVAQWIEHQFPVLRAARSIRAGGTTEHLATVTPIKRGA